MTPLAILALAAAASTAQAEPRGVELVEANVRAVIVRPAIVRQASGLQDDRDGPAPQISRRGATVLVEFQ